MNLAQQILDAIDAQPEAFDMNFWHDSEDGESLGPDETPACGTTMCVAGWAAHLTGWKLRGLDATKNGETRDVDIVAAEALGLDQMDANDIFYAGPNYALSRLRLLAAE